MNKLIFAAMFIVSSRGACAETYEHLNRYFGKALGENERGQEVYFSIAKVKDEDISKQVMQYGVTIGGKFMPIGVLDDYWKCCSPIAPSGIYTLNTNQPNSKVALVFYQASVGFGVRAFVLKSGHLVDLSSELFPTEIIKKNFYYGILSACVISSGHVTLTFVDRGPRIFSFNNYNFTMESSLEKEQFKSNIGDIQYRWSMDGKLNANYKDGRDLDANGLLVEID